MNWADQQPGESRAQWKERMFAVHYGAGPQKLRDMFEKHGRMPQPGDTFTFTFPPNAAPKYSGRSDGGSRTESVLNSVPDWGLLGVELPDLIMVPEPSPEGVYVITRLEA